MFRIQKIGLESLLREFYPASHLRSSFDLSVPFLTSLPFSKLFMNAGVALFPNSPAEIFQCQLREARAHSVGIE